MNDLIVRWVIGRATGETDDQGRQVIEATIATESMSVDGVLRQLRATMLDDDVVAVTVQVGEYDHVAENTRADAASVH